MTDFHFIESSNSAAEERLLGRQYLPASVQGKTLSPVKIADRRFTPKIISVTLSTGGTARFIFLTGSVHRNFLLVYRDYTIYIGSTADPAANLLPGGTAINASDYVVTGPIDTTGLINGVPSLLARLSGSDIRIRNNSGSTQVISLATNVKYIANAGDTTP